MDLEDFVASTLAQISAGIEKAQKQADDTGAWINPGGQIATHSDRVTIEVDAGARVYLENVDFDVAVTAATDQSAGTEGGIRVMGLRLGAEGEVKYENSSVSRVKFSVPVAWPHVRKKELEEDRHKAGEDAKARQRAGMAEAARSV